MSFNLVVLVSSSLGFSVLKGEAITSSPRAIIFISSKGGCVDTIFFSEVVFQSFWNMFISAKG